MYYSRFYRWKCWRSPHLRLIFFMIKNILKNIFLILLFLSFTSLAFAFQADIEQVCFPSGCENIIVEQIDIAKSEIKIQAYSFTSAPIVQALLNAHRRSIDVQIILDKSQKKQRYSSYTFFKNQSIPVYIDSAHAIAHNKIIIIDKQTVITGSFLCGAPHKKLNAESIVMR